MGHYTVKYVKLY